MSFSDRLSSVVRRKVRLYILAFSSLEPLGQFQADMAQNILG